MASEYLNTREEARKFIKSKNLKHYVLSKFNVVKVEWKNGVMKTKNTHLWRIDYAT